MKQLIEASEEEEVNREDMHSLTGQQGFLEAIGFSNLSVLANSLHKTQNVSRNE